MYAHAASGQPIGAWLREADADTDGGRGHATFTADLSAALKFDSMLAAMDFWKTQSTVEPLRADGKPNRPLTAFTVSPVKLSDDGTTQHPPVMP